MLRAPPRANRAAEVACVTEWRAENREAYNAYMRECRSPPEGSGMSANGHSQDR